MVRAMNDRNTSLPPIADLFPPATRDDWRAAAARALKGADVDGTLTSRTVDGLTIQPIYERAQTKAPLPGRSGGTPWTIHQRVDHPDPAEANALALADLEGGAGGLTLVLDGAATARGFGLKLGDAADLALALDGVFLDLIALRFETAPFDGERIIGFLRTLAKARNLPLMALKLDLGLDPVGDLARTGADIGTWLQRAIALSMEAKADGLSGTALRADARPVHEAGGAPAQELAFILGTIADLMRAGETTGHDPAAIRGLTSITLAADADQFVTMAKLRAARLVIGRLDEACGFRSAPLALHAETDWRSLTQRDPYVNVLRQTVATASAGLAGADSVTILPFTAPLGLADGFARRLARNTQHVLIEESHLAKVADPAAGSGGFEGLTQTIAREAWDTFRHIEAGGGIIEALREGRFHEDVAAIAAKRQAQVARRKLPMTGTSEFPDIAERSVDILRPAPPMPTPHPRALPSRRLSEPFETLRDRADILREKGRPARIFLANIGPVAAFTARAMFAKNLFEAGGIEAIMTDGFIDPAEAARAFAAEGTTLACLCSSDALYADYAAPMAVALRGAGARLIAFAGWPGEMETALKSAGIDLFIHAGCDVLAALEHAHDALGDAA